jgi:isocitrate dehydrogenase
MALTVLEHREEIGITPHRRRRVVGVDMWIEIDPRAGDAVGAVRCAASGTHLRLDAAVDTDGNPVAVTGPSGSDTCGVVRVRLLARHEDAHVTDAAITELLARFEERVRWSHLVKLEEFDSVPAYVPLPRTR